MNFTFDSSILDRVTKPDPVGPSQGQEEAAAEFAFWQMGLSGAYQDYLDNVVSVNSALHYSVVWACVRWISQTIASCGFHVFEKKDRSRQQLAIEDDPTAWVIGMQANEETSAYEFWQVMLNHALTDGNGYAEIERDGFGRLQWVWQLGRGRCQPDRTESGQLIYEVSNGSGIKNNVLRPEQVYHLKGLSDDGLVGYSQIEMARRAISIGRSEERFGDDFFSRGPTPGGVFTTKTKLSETAERQARESFDRLYSGKKNVGRVIRLTGDATFTPLSLPNRDAQYLESRRFSVEEICRFYGVPPHKVQHLERSTNNNIEHQGIEAIMDCLMPWARRMESEADIKFFGRVSRGRRFTRVNLRALLRGDMVAQSEALTKQVNGGITKINEAREYLDLNPIDGGDTTLVQGAMIPLDRALNPPEPAPAPQPPAPDDDEPAEPDDDAAPDDAAKVAAVFTPIFADAYKKLLGFEADKARQAARKGKLVAHLAKQYGAEQQAYVAAAFEPIFAAFLLAAKRSGDAKALAAAAAERHNLYSKQLLTAAGKVPDDFGDRGPEIAAELKIAWENSR